MQRLLDVAVLTEKVEALKQEAETKKSKWFSATCAGEVLAYDRVLNLIRKETEEHEQEESVGETIFTEH